MHLTQYYTPATKRKKKMSTSTDDEQGSQKNSSFTSKNIHLKYKTQMCRNYSEVGYCSYYAKCQFAHGFQELNQSKLIKNQFYRTKPCRSFKEKGVCNYGFRCQFSHKYKDKIHDKIGLRLMKQLLNGQIKRKSRLLSIMKQNQQF